MTRRPQATLLAGGAALGVATVRHLSRRSGVGDAEARRRLPGDDLVGRPLWVSTRGITIGAPPSAVWPWIVQMGYPAYRAGWYTPYWLDRIQWGITDRSSDEIREDLQSVSVGDRIPDSLDRSVFFTVEAVERERALVLRSTKHLLPPMRSIDFTWAFILEPIDDRTRFVIRARARYAPRWSWLILGVPYGLGDWLNTTNILHAVKQRAERHAAAAHRLTGDVHAEGRMRSAGRTPGQRPTRRRGAAGVCPGSRSSPPPRPPI